MAYVNGLSKFRERLSYVSLQLEGSDKAGRVSIPAHCTTRQFDGLRVLNYCAFGKQG
jgi:hypothetical protein